MTRQRTILGSVALAALALTIIAAAAVVAQPGPGGPNAAGVGPGRAAGGPARFAERLGLKPEQVEALQKLREAGRTEQLALRKDLMRARHALRGEMLKDSPDGKAVEKLAGEIGALQGRLQATRLQHVLAMRNLLTKEQRDQAFILRGFHGPRGARGDCGFGPGRAHGPRGDRAGRGFGDGAGRGPRGGRPGGPLGFGPGIDSDSDGDDYGLLDLDGFADDPDLGEIDDTADGSDI